MVDLVIAIADLLEAEGRQLRLALIKLVGQLGLLVMALLLVSAGMALLLLALWWLLSGIMTPPLAALVTGLVALGAGGMLWLGTTRHHKN